MPRLLVLLIAGLVVQVQAKEPSYLCAADASTGFFRDSRTDRWSQSTFTPDAKYVVSPSKLTGFTYQVTTLGSNAAVIYCQLGFVTDVLECESLYRMGQFKLNRRTGRFVRSYTMGFVDGSDDTPYIEIGRCSSVD